MEEQNPTYEQLLRSETILKKIVDKTSHKSGQEYLNSLVLTLASTLDADYVFIGTPPTEQKEAIETISLCHKEKIIKNFTYKLAGTPCENVYDKDVCSYSEGVARLFPEDTILKDMGIEAYIGVPLYSEHNKSVGILVCLYTKARSCFFFRGCEFFI